MPSIAARRAAYLEIAQSVDRQAEETARHQLEQRREEAVSQRERRSDMGAFRSKLEARLKGGMRTATANAFAEEVERIKSGAIDPTNVEIEGLWAKFSDAETRQLLEALPVGGLVRLRLIGCELKDEHAAYIAEHMIRSEACPLTHIDLELNHISGNGISAIASALRSPGGQGVRALKLADQRSTIAAAAERALADALTSEDTQHLHPFTFNWTRDFVRSNVANAQMAKRSRRRGSGPSAAAVASASSSFCAGATASAASAKPPRGPASARWEEDARSERTKELAKLQRGATVSVIDGGAAPMYRTRGAEVHALRAELSAAHATIDALLAALREVDAHELPAAGIHAQGSVSAR